MRGRVVQRLMGVPLLWGIGLGSPMVMSAEPDQTATVQQLRQQLETLKRNYIAEIRRMRALEARLMALEAKAATAQKTAAQAEAQQSASAVPQAGKPADKTPPTVAANNRPSARKKPVAPKTVRRSLQSVAKVASFEPQLTLEAGVAYSHYDRNELTLNGFLALDAIFLGNIAINKVTSDKLTYSLAARYGFAPRWQAGVTVPFIQRSVTYQKGGVGGAANVVGETSQSAGPELGDVSLNLSYQLNEPKNEDVLWSAQLEVTAPTGSEPYGISSHRRTVYAPGSNDSVDIEVPDKLATGNGLWGYGVTLSAIKTLDPTVLFANVGYSAFVPGHFNDIDSDPNTRTPGDVQLGDTWQFGVGAAFAFNRSTSLTLSFSDQLRSAARIRSDGSGWTRLIGSDANAATLNASLTYALSAQQLLIGALSIGLTPDAPDFSFQLRMPFTM